MCNAICITLVFLLAEVLSDECPKYPPLPEFNMNEYAGKWYEISHLNHTETIYECGCLVIDLEMYNVNYTAYKPEIDEFVNYTAQLKPIDSQPGSYDLYVNNKKIDIPYRVLKTDYFNYAIVGGCIADRDKTKERLLIYSRNRTLNDMKTVEVKEFVNSIKIEYDTLVKVKQEEEQCGRNGFRTTLPNILYIFVTLPVVFSI